MMVRVPTILSAAALLASCTTTHRHEATGQAMECNKPVYMLVTGITHDRERMMAYVQAISETDLYQRLGGYYVTMPKPIAYLEGEEKDGYVSLVVRFPCRENAEAFWNSRTYQEEILPIRLGDPPAADYTITLHTEAPWQARLEGKVGKADYRHDFANHGVEQIGEER